MTELQDAEEVYEVLFLFVCEPNLEAAIVEVHQYSWAGIFGVVSAYTTVPVQLMLRE